MFSFIDQNGCTVNLSFDEGPFEIEPKHVLILVRYNGKWLCTINKKRGVEFPGGKVELGESLQQAAIREVYEETAVHISDLKWFAYYVVHDKEPFCKAVFTGKVERIDEFIEEHETLGMTWLSTEELNNHPNLSFYMKDEGMKKMLQEVNQHEREW
ncbi:MULTISPECIES: NUDIX domain-containing protein [Lysinibacillus]|uniref:NUDIX domain-containing protein n=1 Tax=Lysinibacillus antri TaxID=2498145 RepID=A0A3S0QRY6_9BACI|nr:MULTISPECIES: NUDIX domain-containing protein [Lysinibacillus]RUL56552.1 NUDIX domain-containing protein [Lysinibacillus antri]TSI03038.1 NUDIX domain-containing protein [Lysinibacillus sp. BW-2-10]